MNNRAFLAAIFIAVLATSATFVSPAAAASSQRENTPDTVLSIPTNSVKYEVNGTFFAYVNLTSCKVIVSATGIPGFSSVNITIPEFYLAIRISVGAKNIVFNLTNPAYPFVEGNVSVDVTVTGRYDLYFNYTHDNGFHRSDSFNKHDSKNWIGRWFIPWGTTKNFTMPFPVFEMSPTEPNATTPQPEAGIKFTNENLTGSDVSWTVTHTTWDFSNWLREKVNDTLNGFAGEAMQGIAAAGIPGISMGFTVPTSVARVDLWKANATKDGTTIPNVLLMASALVNLLVRYYLIGQGTFSGNIGGQSVTLNYDINIGADFGMFFSLIVLNDLGNKVLNNYTISEFDIQVPENATLTWRKIGVIVYYGSPAHGCDVTGGVTRGNATAGGGTLFFVDYGWDGEPDFLTDGTTGSTIAHPAATVSGTTFPFTVTLDKTVGGWLSFSLPLPSGTSKSSIIVTRSGGVTVNSTQYWIEGNVLYVCDDPVYTYTVQLVSGAGLGAGLSTLLIVGAAAVVVVLVLALVFMRRRGGKPTSVTIK